MVDTNPVGATDNVDEGDDHIRNIKTAVQGSFPSLGAAAVTKTAAQINDLATLTGSETLTNKALTSPTINGVTSFMLVPIDVTGGFYSMTTTDDNTGASSNWTTVSHTALATAGATHAIIRVYVEAQTTSTTSGTTADVIVHLGTSGYSGAPSSSPFVDTAAATVRVRKVVTASADVANIRNIAYKIIKLDGSQDFQYSVYRSNCHASTSTSRAVLDVVGYYV